MEQIYWITRLGAIHGLLVGLIIMSIVGFIISLVMLFVEPSREGEEDFCESMRFHGKRLLRCVLIVFPIICALAVFIPTQEDAYMIYGLGGTIDYIKDSPTAKQLPEKTLQMLNAWEDNQIEKLQKDTTKTNN